MEIFNIDDIVLLGVGETFCNVTEPLPELLRHIIEWLPVWSVGLNEERDISSVGIISIYHDIITLQ